MKVETNRRKQFLTQTYSYQYELRGNFPSEHLPKIIDFICLKWIEVVQDEAAELRNLKGRNKNDITLPFSTLPVDDELLFARGEISLGPQPTPSGAQKPFQLSVTTPFLKFDGYRDIVHHLEVSRLGALPSWFNYRTLGAAVPLSVSEFRFGLEYFQPLRTVFSFGVTPSVTQSVVVEYQNDELYLRVQAERLPTKESEPFEPYLQQLIELIQQ